jgi:hypothetical protein
LRRGYFQGLPAVFAAAAPFCVWDEERGQLRIKNGQRQRQRRNTGGLSTTLRFGRDDVVRAVGTDSEQVGGGYGYGGYGGGFGAEDAGAEGDGLPVVMGEEGDFFGGPAAFGADGQGVRDAGRGGGFVR